MRLINIYTIATVLNGSLTLSDLNGEERMEYNTAIIEWLERTADSQDERVREIQSVFILATKYVQMEKYRRSKCPFEKNSDTVIDATIMKTSVLAHQEGTDTARYSWKETATEQLSIFKATCIS